MAVYNNWLLFNEIPIFPLR